MISWAFFTTFSFGELPGDRAWTLFCAYLGHDGERVTPRGMALQKDGGDIPEKFAGTCVARLSPRGGILRFEAHWAAHGSGPAPGNVMGPHGL